MMIEYFNRQANNKRDQLATEVRDIKKQIGIEREKRVDAEEEIDRLKRLIEQEPDDHIDFFDEDYNVEASVRSSELSIRSSMSDATVVFVEDKW